MQDSRLIQKMKKLMAMANDKSSEHEATTALRQLHALLAKHNISMEQIESADEEREEIQETFEQHKDRPWKRMVALSIARSYFCEMYYVKLGGGKSNYAFVGTEANRTFALAIFNMVVRTIERESRAESRKLYGKEVSGFVNSFWTGAMNRICERCDQLIKAAKEGTLEDDEGNNLPVMVSTYDLQSKRVNDWLSANHNLKQTKTRTRATDVNGARAGRAAGNRVQLSRGLQGKTAPKALGRG